MSAGWKRFSRRAIVWVVIGGIAFIALVGVTFNVTERPAFCPTCHEMGPFYDAWSTSGMRKVSCIKCHVAPGLPNRVLHKFVALKEVWDHFTTKPEFPHSGVEMPDSRCTQCHAKIALESTTRFSHKLHAGKGPCKLCHAAAAHKVTFDALETARILAPGARSGGATFIGQIALQDKKASVMPGHKIVECSRCHDMANAQCSACHTPPGQHFGDDCRACHTPTTPFKDTVFNHPRAGEHSFTSFPCAYCHPNGFKSASCVRCHAGGAPTGD